MSKSEIVGINVCEEEMNSLGRVIGCEVGSWPLSYLGMPLGDNPRRVGFWNPVIEKVSKRLEGWVKGCLSKGGRLTLIQAVLESIPTYYLSLFKIPVAVANEIEKRLRNFLWEGYGEVKSDHLVNWKNVSKSKRNGGLGIGNILKKNEALLGKWLWRFPLEQGSFWCSIIKSKYGLHKNGWDSNVVGNGSHRNPWKAISFGYEIFLTFTRFKVGNGVKTRFWEDVWVGNISFASLYPRLYRISLNSNSHIASLLSWNPLNSYSWNLSFRRDLNDNEIENFLGLMNSVGNFDFSRSIEDSRIWMGDKSGIFSSKSFFELLISSSVDQAFVPYKKVWKSGIPPKVKVFAWLASWRKVNTYDLLQVRRPYLSLSPSWCCLCKENSESIDHILIHCPYAYYIWGRVRKEFDLIAAFPRTWYDFLSIDWSFKGNKKRVKVLWRCCCMAVMWCLWQERNARIFEDRFGDASEIWFKIKSLASLWAFSSRIFGILSISDISRDWSAAAC